MKGIGWPVALRFARLDLAVVFLVTIPCAEALALTHEELLQACRESVGTPIVRACMGGQRGEQVLAACREKSAPAVRACYQERVKQEASRKPPPPAPKMDVAPVKAGAVATSFVAPPRSIADITAILDQEKPDAQRIARNKVEADAPPPQGLSAKDLATFYYNRANARNALSRNDDAIADARKAIEAGKGQLDVRHLSRLRQLLAAMHQAKGELHEAITVYKTIIKDGDQPAARGTMINSSRSVAQVLVSMGDVGQADSFARRVAGLVQEARASPHPNWRTSYAVYGNSWESDADATRGIIFEARGQYREAEAAYRRSEAFRRASLNDLSKFEYPVPAALVRSNANQALLSAARVIMKQGRLGEAEAEARRALLESLKLTGKYHTSMPPFVLGLADILIEQGRHEEAESLVRAAVEIQQSLGVAPDGQSSVTTLALLANVLTLQYKDEAAAGVYAQIEKAVARWEPQRKEVFLLNSSRVHAFYAAGRIKEGISAAQALLKRQTQRFGEKHFDTASARGALGIGYAMDGQAALAVHEFKTALPILLNATGESAEDDDTTVVAARKQRLQMVVEHYIRVLGRSGDTNAAIKEGLALADAVRGQSVQNALAASSARMLARDPALAELVRNEQDLGKQLGAQLGALNNALALPLGERDENGVRALRASVEKLRGDRQKSRQTIIRRFPEYADLIDPKPPTLSQLQSTLRKGEAVLSFYFGRDASFVWSIPKEGKIAFAEIPAKAIEVEAMVSRLRDALEPGAPMVSDIPAFDLALAHQLYKLLLKPVEESLQSSDSLVVVTNGALGLLPLSLLPTQDVKLDESGSLFSGYKQVPWLARTHAVSLVPSASALMTLRKLPAVPATHEPLIAFGDPFFSVKQAQDVTPVVEAVNYTSRGIPLARRSAVQTRGIDSAELAELPRLPDTADELRAIARALGADPEKVLHLGAQANEKIARTINLSNYRVVAFATHGLVPGDLNGLTQPALALSAPAVAGVDGDGLLTMEEILALRMNADWVVLSACNTGAGAGAGAEAASGLGRAFFYAGTRAVLVTNWSVHSRSARDLVADLFHRQAQDKQLPRAKALQQAMLALMDGPGFVDDKGETGFAYAHPLFWAPYSMIGDGG